MFSKKSLVPQSADPAPAFNAQALIGKALANPYVSAGGAGALFLATALVLIALLGDPRAGTPAVRISLARMAAMAAPPGWREALTTESPTTPAVSEDIYSLSETPIRSRSPSNSRVTGLAGTPSSPRS